MTMEVSHKGTVVKLRAFKRDDVPVLVEHFSSMKVQLYTLGIFGQPLENELEWYDKNRQDPDSVTWAIVPHGQDTPIGVTGLHKINSRNNSCTSGIIIWDSTWWGRGVATAAHLGRTLFAADYLNRWMIRSSAYSQNEASWRAMERVGYTVWGTEPVFEERAGKWLCLQHTIWLHPERVAVLFPDGLPEKYAAGVERATIALETARKEVAFP